METLISVVIVLIVMGPCIYLVKSFLPMMRAFRRRGNCAARNNLPAEGGWTATWRCDYRLTYTYRTLQQVPISPGAREQTPAILILARGARRRTCGR
jgi:hypothetical protein